MTRWLVLLVLLGGCAGLPAAAYPVPSSDLQAVRGAWVAAGYPDCPALTGAYVLPAGELERVTLCGRPVDSCLTTLAAGPMRRELVAVVSPEFPDGWRHEVWHALEHCAWGAYDYGHAGPQWQAPRKTAGIP